MRKLNEFVTIKAPDEVPGHLLELSSSASSLALAAYSVMPRTNKTVALGNFCNYVARELRAFGEFFPANVSGMAWACRNLFESNLIVRVVIADDAVLNSWMGQMLRDEKDFIEGILSTADPQDMNAVKQVLSGRVEQLDEISRCHGIAPSKPFNTSELAKKLGMLDEYTSMYKLFSKYVHPSSLLLNSWQKQDPPVEWTNIFLIKAQVYAGDSARRIGDALPAQSGSA